MPPTPRCKHGNTARYPSDCGCYKNVPKFPAGSEQAIERGCKYPEECNYHHK